jgi:hypothetical protein
MYKNCLTFCFLTFSFFQSMGQQFKDTYNPHEIKAIISAENELEVFGGTDIKVGNVNTERAMLLGAYGGVMVNRHYMLGLAGYGIATNPKFQGVLMDGTLRKLTINGGYAGVMLGGVIWGSNIVHIAIPVILGAGSLSLSDDNFFQNNLSTDFTIESSTFFVGEPGFQLEFNFTPTLRIATGVSYRLVQGLQLINLSDRAMSDWTATISIRFGRF